MRILGLLVTKNEADRYLASSVTHLLAAVVDDLLVYDDRSEDDTREVAGHLGAKVLCREQGVPSFLENESLFRQAAWEKLGEELKPMTNDWVLSVDADEFPVAPDGSFERDVLEHLAFIADAKAYGSVSFPVAEVFGCHEGRPLVRHDGFWGAINGARFAQWTDDCIFRRQELAGGSLPASCAPCMKTDGAITILHMGYADEVDRLAKYDRYRGRAGHSSRHVDSIVAPPTLEPWHGAVPNIWREARANV